MKKAEKFLQILSTTDNNKLRKRIDKLSEKEAKLMLLSLVKTIQVNPIFTENKAELSKIDTLNLNTVKEILSEIKE